MLQTTFEKIIVIGYGKVTGEILKYIIERQEEFGYGVEFIEHEVHPFGITEKICSEHRIPFARIENKKELAAHFGRISEKTLIVSASNNFLFPKELVEKENITIINFHNALLPDYPGRNAPSWVIFMGEKESGITWHYVTAGIDEGNIIIQKHCEIGADMKAYELAGQLMELAYDAFTECFEEIVKEIAKTKAQSLNKTRRMYRSYEVPGNGFFEMTQEPESIYRLLRSMDYGKNGVFPPAQTVIDGERAEILRYRKVTGSAEKLVGNPDNDSEGTKKLTEDKEKKEEGFRCLPLTEGEWLKIKFRLQHRTAENR